MNINISKEEIEKTHDMGIMPDWVYYQVNGKDINENWRKQHDKIIDKVSIR